MEFRVFDLFFSSEPLSDSFGMLERHFEWGRTGKLLSKTEVSRLPVDLLIDRLIACEIMMVRNWQELWQCSLCCLLKCITAVHLSCNEFDRQIQFSILKCCEHSGLSLVDESQKPFSWSINQAKLLMKIWTLKVWLLFWCLQADYFNYFACVTDSLCDLWGANWAG